VIKRLTALICLVALVCVGVPLIGKPDSSSAAPAFFGRVHESYRPESGKVFILVIGNDARSGNPDASRADAIHIVGINTKTMKGGILNFPRDSWVSVPGYHTAKINEALYAGGPKLLAQTLENVTGIHIDYWVMTGFEGFRGIVDELGGVKMNIPTDVYDPTGSGAKLKAGTQNLGPLNALAYVRTRHSFGAGDIARTSNQGSFLLAMLRKLQRQVDGNPATLLRWMAITRKYARLDVGADELFRLGVIASQVKPGDVGNVTVPVSLGSVGAASVVFISSGAQSLYERFRENASL
jgi:LCP family protein required for cell wall assembly